MCCDDGECPSRSEPSAGAASLAGKHMIGAARGRRGGGAGPVRPARRFLPFDVQIIIHNMFSYSLAL